MEVSWVDPVRRRTVEIVGSRRSAVIKAVDQSMEIYGEGDLTRVNVDSNNTIRTEIENFIDATRTGKNKFNSAIVGARTVDTIQMAQDNA
jgi:predicted dehydrogenase